MTPDSFMLTITHNTLVLNTVVMITHSHYFKPQLGITSE